MVDSIIEFRNNYLKELDSLVLYINSFSENKESNQQFTNYKKIIYPSIINNIYVSFEHHIKSLFLFLYRKVEANNEKSINLNNFSFQSFPGFILEKAYMEKNKMILELNDEVISFTSKNMDVGVICDLFYRVGIEKELLTSKIETVDSRLYEVPFEEQRTIRGKIKFFINHRNQISHSFIEEYYENEVLLVWIEFFKEIYCVIFKSTIGTALETISLNKVRVIKIYQDNIICFDNTENINLTKKSILCYESSQEYYFYEVKTIKSNGEEIEQTSGFKEIGLSVKAIYDEKKIVEQKEISIFI